MIYISICNADRETAQRVKTLISQELNLRGHSFQCRIYCDGSSFLEHNQKEEQELIFLDPALRDRSGLQIAEHLKQEGRNRQIVFVAGSASLVFESLSYFPFSFIRKADLEEQMGALAEEFLKSREVPQEVFTFKVQKQTVAVPLNTIMYLTYWEHKIFLVTNQGEWYEFRGSLKECERQLAWECFFRINSGAVINFNFVKMLEGEGVVMEDNRVIWMSRQKKRECRQKFMECQRRTPSPF